MCQLVSPLVCLVLERKLIWQQLVYLQSRLRCLHDRLDELLQITWPKVVPLATLVVKNIFDISLKLKFDDKII